jgi:hypothetical protein
MKNTIQTKHGRHTEKNATLSFATFIKKNTSKYYIMVTIQKYIKTIIDTETKSIHNM